jgi:oligogalacturonide lyase
MDKMESSMYYNSATDGSFFCGSGRRSESAHGDDPSEGQTLRSREWIEVLHPILNDADSGADPQYANWFHYNNTSSSGAPNAKYTGWFRRERLVNMYKNDYTKFEPNVRVSPDNRLVIFTSNMFGPTYVFGVEVN